MQIKTILNRVQKYKSFVYGAVHWVEEATVPTLEVEMEARTNSRPVCGRCGCKRPGLRQVACQALRVHSDMGDQGVFGLSPPPAG